MPEIKGATLQFGTVVHSVLERACALHRRAGTLPGDTEVRAMLESALERLPLSVPEYARLFEKGQKALFAYLPHLARTLPQVTREEFSLKVMWKTGEEDIPEIPLTGTIDRLDFDEEGRVVRVIDYKTGRSKSVGEIRGTTKNSTGGYKRQLVFYALLLSLCGNDRYACRNCVLSFVEPNGKGEIVERQFTITDEEIEELKGEIIRVVREITNGAFLDAPCDSNVCEYCDLVSALGAIPPLPRAPRSAPEDSRSFV